jgi:hypothetical protein
MLVDLYLLLKNAVEQPNVKERDLPYIFPLLLLHLRHPWLQLHLPLLL